MDPVVVDIPVDNPPLEQAAAKCPRCQKSLVDPSGLGWCPGCGYCQSLEDSHPKTILSEKRPSVGGVVEAGGAVAQLPLWFWVSLLVVANAVFLSIVAGKQLPEGANLSRALWSTLQIAIGLLLVFLAQAWILIHIAPDEPTLTFKDSILSFRLWNLAIKRLPRFQASLWTAVLGFSLALGAILFVGGMKHWFSYMPHNRAAQEKLQQEKDATRGGPLVIE